MAFYIDATGPPFNPLDYYEAPSHLKPPCKLITLPKELLATIALQVDLSHNRDLCNLALTCKPLRQIAQEALLKPAKVKQNGIRGFLEMLVNRPDLAIRVHHVDLGRYAVGYERRTNDLVHPSDFELSTHKKFEALVTEKRGAELWEEVLQGREEDRWGFGRSYFLALLTIVAPNLDELTFEMRPLVSPLEELDMLPTHVHIASQELIAPFGRKLMDLLGAKLTNLTISNGAHRTPHMHNLVYNRLRNLKHLNVPIGTFIRKNALIITPIEALLPAGLEWLHVRDCNHYTVQLLMVLKIARLPRLKYIDLFFSCSLQSALVAGCGLHMEGIIVPHGWKIILPNNIDLFTHTRSHSGMPYEKTNISTEWEAWSFLSFGEVALASMKGDQFSEVVARNTDGTPRARTSFEIKLLRRFWGMNYRLFASPTFDAPAWAGVRMFNGPNVWIKQKSSTVKALPKHPNQKLKMEVKKKLIGKTMFDKKPVMTPAAEKSETFDALGWCKMNFFEQQSKTEVPQATLKTKKPVVMEAPRRRKMTTNDDKIDEVLALATAWKLQLDDGDD
jgi:hypothetical protein